MNNLTVESLSVRYFHANCMLDLRLKGFYVDLELCRGLHFLEVFQPVFKFVGFVCNLIAMYPCINYGVCGVTSLLNTMIDYWIFFITLFSCLFWHVCCNARIALVAWSGTFLSNYPKTMEFRVS